jgi:hypothetical protein
LARCSSVFDVYRVFDACRVFEGFGVLDAFRGSRAD